MSESEFEIKPIPFLTQQNHEERKVVLDFTIIDRLKLLGASRSQYIDQGLSDKAYDIISDPRSEDVLGSALYSCHRTSNGSVFSSENAMKTFEFCLDLQFKKYVIALDAIALKASLELLMAYEPLLFCSRRNIPKVRTKHSLYIRNKLISHYELRRSKYKDFNPTDDEIASLAEIPPRKPPSKMQYIEQFSFEKSYREAVEKDLSGLELYVFCAESSGLMINEFMHLIPQD